MATTETRGLPGRPEWDEGLCDGCVAIQMPDEGVWAVPLSCQMTPRAPGLVRRATCDDAIADAEMRAAHSHVTESQLTPSIPMV